MELKTAGDIISSRKTALKQFKFFNRKKYLFARRVEKIVLRPRRKNRRRTFQHQKLFYDLPKKLYFNFQNPIRQSGN